MQKKMIKPLKGLKYDEFVHSELHTNEVMFGQDDQLKESRRRHLRILEAALREPVVDACIVLSIQVQLSRKAFFNEIQIIFDIAYENVVAL